jgi:DNA-binding GntR family transcriptional regulator
MAKPSSAPWGLPTFERPSQLSLEVATYVRELILSGQVAAPEPLTIDRLARELGVSATPVREALLSLRGEGFVDFEPRRGFTVSPLSSRDIADLFWAHAELAAELTRRAVVASDADLVTTLRATQAALCRAVADSDPQTTERLNHVFHRAINLAAEAPKLTWLLRATFRYTPRRFFGSIPGWVEASVGDHDGIIDAIELGDGDAAGDAMRSHIRHAGELLIENLTRGGRR